MAYNMLEQYIQNQMIRPWKEKSFLYKVLCAPLSFVYNALMSFRNKMYDFKILKSKKLPGITISVGNISVGGTGKSPFVMSICQLLKEQGLYPAILTRGYKSRLKKGESSVLINSEMVVLPQSLLTHKEDISDFKLFADEASMYSSTLAETPVIIGSNRFEAMQRFAREHPDIGKKITHWILDDGFQHRSIERDVNILIIDQSRTHQSGYVLPLGDLRESKENVKRADVILIAYSVKSKSNQGIDFDRKKDELKSTIVTKPDVLISPITFSNDWPQHITSARRITKDDFPVMLVTAIARPERVVESLKAFDIQISKKIFIRDHALIKRELLTKNQDEIKSVIITAKDYWRDPEVFSKLNIPVFIFPQKVFFEHNIFLSWLKKSKKLDQ